MRFLTLVVAAVVLATTPALAQTNPQGPPVPEQNGSTTVEQPEIGARPDPDAEVICRVVEETGSRLARRRQRICGTRTMWEEMEDRNARDAQRVGSVNTTPTN